MKALIEFLRTLLFKTPVPHSGKLPIYVRCDRCGESLSAAIDLQHDLSVEYGHYPSGDHYLSRKTLIGSSGCFQRIQIELRFDSRKRLTGADVQGGKRITKKEFDMPFDPDGSSGHDVEG